MPKRDPRRRVSRTVAASVTGTIALLGTMIVVQTARMPQKVSTANSPSVAMACNVAPSAIALRQSLARSARRPMVMLRQRITRTGTDVTMPIWAELNPLSANQMPAWTPITPAGIIEAK